MEKEVTESLHLESLHSIHSVSCLFKRVEKALKSLR